MPSLWFFCIGMISALKYLQYKQWALKDQSMSCNKIPTGSSSHVLKKIKKKLQLKAFVEHAFQIFSWLHVDKGFSKFQEHSKYFFNNN